MSFVDIAAKLETLLATISDLQLVIDYEASGLEGYPIAQIIASGNDSEITSTNSVTRTYNFTVRIIQEITSGGEEEAERIMREVVDQVIDTIDTDRTLGISNASSVQGTSSSWDRDDGAAGVYRFADVAVSVKIQVDLPI